jgi:hypothetical protein
MGWTETPSLSFTARHEAAQSDAAIAVLESLETYRAKLEDLFPQAPANVTVVLHDSALQLALAQPYFPLARRLTAPAGRRYMAGWFNSKELHTLAPDALRRLAAGPDSRRALMLTPERTYTMLVVGSNNPLLPPPFRPSTFRNGWRLAWLAEGAAQYFSGQLPHLRAAIARRLRSSAPSCPPSLRDAALLGGSLFDLLALERGVEACVGLATDPDVDERTLESVFESPLAELRERWRSHLEELARAEPAVRLDANRERPSG